jgi:hypothetical protein
MWLEALPCSYLACNTSTSPPRALQVGVDLGISNNPVRFAAVLRSLASDPAARAQRAALRRGGAAAGGGR